MQAQSISRSRRLPRRADRWRVQRDSAATPRPLPPGPMDRGWSLQRKDMYTLRDLLFHVSTVSRLSPRPVPHRALHRLTVSRWAAGGDRPNRLQPFGDVKHLLLTRVSISPEAATGVPSLL